MKLSILSLVVIAVLLSAPLVCAQSGQSQTQNQTQDQNQQTQKPQKKQEQKSSQGQPSQQSPQTNQQQVQPAQQQTAAPQQNSQPSLKNPLQDIFPPTPPPVDPKEQAAFQSFVQIQPGPPNDDAEIKAGQSFVKTYPNSRFREVVYSRLANAYLDEHQTDNMCAAAEKALALNPDDVTVLIPVGEAIPRSSPTSPKFSARLARAEQYELHAISILTNMTKPAALTDAQFSKTKTDALAEAHSGLGLVYFDEKKFDQSATQLQAATGGSPALQATNDFVLGLDLVNLQKLPDAVKSFDACSQISSSIQTRCRQASAQAKAREAAAQKQKP